MAKKVPLRQCIGCGEMKSKREMLRILKTAEGDICLDVTGKKNGRGAYICTQRECLQKARRNKGLERSFKMSIPDEVYETLNNEFDGLDAARPDADRSNIAGRSAVRGKEESIEAK